jgi:hypothetical protein
MALWFFGVSCFEFWSCCAITVDIAIIIIRVNKTEWGSGLMYTSCSGNNSEGAEHCSSGMTAVRPIYQATSSPVSVKMATAMGSRAVSSTDSSYILSKSREPKLYTLECCLSNKVKSHLSLQDVASLTHHDRYTQILCKTNGSAFETPFWVRQNSSWVDLFHLLCLKH